MSDDAERAAAVPEEYFNWWTESEHGHQNNVVHGIPSSITALRQLVAKARAEGFEECREILKMLSRRLTPAFDGLSGGDLVEVEVPVAFLREASRLLEDRALQPGKEGKS